MKFWGNVEVYNVIFWDDVDSKIIAIVKQIDISTHLKWFGDKNS